MMQVNTARFGLLEIEESKIILMPQGMLGFGEKRFILLTPSNLAPFCWLQSVDNPDLAFVVTDAKNWDPGVNFKLTAEECESLELGEQSEVIFLLVVTMAPDPKNITVNLRGPIVLNPERQIARQIVIEGENYVTRHPFFSASEKIND
jgi:flagellar assembly factor FliW